MDLDKAMIALAGAVARSSHVNSEALTPLVRSALLNLEAGHPIDYLPIDQYHQIIEWLQSRRSSSLDLAGTLYEEMLGRVVFAGKNGFEVRIEKSVHRSTGAYYTVEPIVRYMVRRAAELGDVIGRVLDPACGSGAFLQGISDFFPPSVRIAGFESDPVSAAICKSRLSRAQVHVLDALHTQFDDRFDLVIGNPPYISHGLRGAPAMGAPARRLLTELYPQTSEYKLNTYPLFIERGLQLLRPGGVLGYIIPDSFLTGRYFLGLRKLLLANRILEITLIQQDFWRHGSVGQSVILFVQKQPPVLSDQITIRVCKSVSDLETVCGVQVSQTDISWGQHQRFRLVPNPDDRRFLAAMESGAETQPGRELFQTYSGLIGRAGQESLLWTSTGEGDTGKLIRSGKQIDRYFLQWQGHEVNLDARLFKSGYKLSFYQNPKLFLRQTADSLRASFDDQGYYCLNNIHLVIPKSSVDPRALLAVFNSKVLNRYYGLVTMESGRPYPQVDLDLVKELPFPTRFGRDVDSLAKLTIERERATPEGVALTQIEIEIDRLVTQSYRL